MKIGKGSWVSPKASVYGGENIVIGDNVRIDDFCILSGGEKGLKIGNHIHIAAGVKLFGGGGIIIENFAQISVNSVVMSRLDDFSGRSLIGPCIPMKYKPTFSSSPVRICKHVIIGVGVFIMPGVIVGEGVAVGANSVVKKNCIPWKIYGGVPAHIIGSRKKAMIKLGEDFLKEYEGGDKI